MNSTIKIEKRLATDWGTILVIHIPDKRFVYYTIKNFYRAIRKRQINY